MADRIFARELIERYIPKEGLPYFSDFKYSDRRHNEIINSFQLPDGTVYREYGGQGYGTTCGFLCHWLLFRLGVTDTNILNRTTFRANLKPGISDFEDFETMNKIGFNLPGKRITKDKSGKLIHASPANEDIHFQTFYENTLNINKLDGAKKFTWITGASQFDKLRNLQFGDICLIQGGDKRVDGKDSDNKAKADAAQKKPDIVDPKTHKPATFQTAHVFIINKPIGSTTLKDIISFETVESGQNSLGGDKFKDILHKERTFKIVNKQITVVGDGDRTFRGFLSLDDLGLITPKVEFDEWPLYDPALARMYYQGHGISSISIPEKNMDKSIRNRLKI